MSAIDPEQFKDYCVICCERLPIEEIYEAFIKPHIRVCATCNYYKPIRRRPVPYRRSKRLVPIPLSEFSDDKDTLGERW